MNTTRPNPAYIVSDAEFSAFMHFCSREAEAEIEAIAKHLSAQERTPAYKLALAWLGICGVLAAGWVLIAVAIQFLRSVL